MLVYKKEAMALISNNYILKEAYGRAKVLKIKKQVKINSVLISSFFLTLIFSFYKIIEIEVPEYIEPSLSYASVMNIDNCTSVYVSIALIMFVLGVFLTIIFKNKTKRRLT